MSKIRRRGETRTDGAELQKLGERIRTLRAQRGMTRRTLATASHVSERFLAQLEAGKGNPSLLILKQVSEALSAPIDALVSEAGIRPVDYTLIMQTLGRLEASELEEVRRWLSMRFRKIQNPKENYVALIGLRGAGKTTLGSRLAEHMKVPFVELDRVIEEEYGASIGEILALNGQAAYLRHERQSMERTLDQYERAVIEVGGGLATDPEALDLLLERTQTVWVQASPEEHMQRVIDQGDLRPMGSSKEAMEDLRAILAAREPFYHKAAIHLSTTGKTVTESRRQLIKLLKH